MVPPVSDDRAAASSQQLHATASIATTTTTDSSNSMNNKNENSKKQPNTSNAYNHAQTRGRPMRVNTAKPRQLGHFIGAEKPSRHSPKQPKHGA